MRNQGYKAAIKFCCLALARQEMPDLLAFGHGAKQGEGQKYAKGNNRNNGGYDLADSRALPIRSGAGCFPLPDHGLIAGTPQGLDQRRKGIVN